MTNKPHLSASKSAWPSETPPGACPTSAQTNQLAHKSCVLCARCAKKRKSLSLSFPFSEQRAETRRSDSLRLNYPVPRRTRERATKAYTLGFCGRGRAYQLPGPCGRVTTVGGVGVMIYDVCCRPLKKKGEILETVDWPKVSPQKACTEPHIFPCRIFFSLACKTLLPGVSVKKAS